MACGSGRVLADLVSARTPGIDVAGLGTGPLRLMRPAKARIDLAAVRHNLREARRRGGGAKVAAIVKADAYGHGAARVLPALAEADMLGVACIEEALALREAGADTADPAHGGRVRG